MHENRGDLEEKRSFYMVKGLEKQLSRRDFLRDLGMVTAGAFVASVSSGCTSVALNVAAGTEMPEVAGSTPYFNETPGHLLTPTPTPKFELKPSLTPTPDVWKLSLDQRVELMAKPEFFTELQGENTRKIITFQYDEAEYAQMERYAFLNNSCGQATLATIVKMCKFLDTGTVPDITISDINKVLNGVTFTDTKGFTAKYIVWDDEMYFVGLADALKLIIPQLISKTEFLTPNYGARYTRILPGSRWPEAFSKAQTVCEEGGFVIIGCLKYGGGHILLATDVKKNGRATIVDSRGEGEYSYGNAQKDVILENYFAHAQDPEAMGLGLQPALLHMIGVTPRLNV